jgi:hypothetical protein
LSTAEGKSLARYAQTHPDVLSGFWKVVPDFEVLHGPGMPRTLPFTGEPFAGEHGAGAQTARPVARSQRR